MHVYKSNVKRAVMFEWLNVEMPKLLPIDIIFRTNSFHFFSIYTPIILGLKILNDSIVEGKILYTEFGTPIVTNYLNGITNNRYSQVN